MDQFESYLKSGLSIPEKRRKFYLAWVSGLFAFHNKGPMAEISTDEIEAYLRRLSKSREEWQVKQAKEAIDLFLFFRGKRLRQPSKKSLDMDAAWKEAADEMVRMLRLKHRLTVLPESLKNDLRDHMETVQELFAKDRREDVAGVYCSNHDDLYPCGPEECTGGQEPVGFLTG
jgi:hypothetical protein